MTKRVRIENADVSAYGVVVEVWEANVDPNKEDVLFRTINLRHPSNMTDTFINACRYLIVREGEIK